MAVFPVVRFLNVQIFHWPPRQAHVFNLGTLGLGREKNDKHNCVYEDSIDQHKLWNGDAHLFFFFTCNDDNVFLIIIYPDFTCMYPVILFYLHKSMK